MTRGTTAATPTSAKATGTTTGTSTGTTTDTRFRRAAVLWSLAILAVLVLTGIAVAVVNSRLHGPEHAVRAYVDALRDGDGSRALGLLGATVPEGDATLLTGEPLKRSVEGLSGVELSDERRDGDDATVTARYTLDGTEASTAFAVHRTGRRWLFFDQWALEPTTLPRTDVTLPGYDRASVDGATVGLPAGRARLVSFYPARIEASYTSTLVRAPARTATVTSPSARGSVALAAGPTPAMTAAVTGQLRTGLNRCAAQKVLAPSGCPFYHFTDARISGPIAWSITAYPTPVIEDHDGTWTIRPLTGRARLTTRETDLYSGVERDVDATEDFTFGADLAVDGDTVTVHPQITGPDPDADTTG